MRGKFTPGLTKDFFRFAQAVGGSAVHTRLYAIFTPAMHDGRALNLANSISVESTSALGKKMNSPRTQFGIRHFRRHLERLRCAPGRVEDCLAYPSMFDVPEAFEVWCVADFKRRRAGNPALMWVDACPAYALAVATHAMYGDTVMMESDDELDAQWDELRGHSNLDWQRAREIVWGAWSALDGLALAPPPVAGSPQSPAHKVGSG